jgi:aspartyl-tRNA(Asn)/glutamyl-tRNA(Gln) amidotransferase subunit A
MNLHELTIEQAVEKMDRGEISSVELTENCLDRIEAIDGKLNAFITVDRKGALQQASAADEKRKKGEGGMLCGIPLSIKDLLSTKDMRTTCGSKILENFVPVYDATVIKKIRKEGGVILGKVAMDEFAMGSTSETCVFGAPHNPYKKGYVAGGSSGGSAASVAAMECLGSLGSDTGGSIRQPASLCGVVGIKPTYGRVSRFGLVAFASSLDQVGPLARNVADCARLLSSISGYDRQDSTSVKQPVPDFSGFLGKSINGMKVGIPREYFGEGLDPEIAEIVKNGIKILQEGGAETVDVSLPHTEYCVAVYYLIAPSEASSNLARYDGALYGFRDEKSETLLEMYKNSRSSGFGDEVKRRILIGTYALSSGYYDAYYKKASQVRTLILEDYKNVFRECDVILSPVTPQPAWKMGENKDDPLSVYLSDIMTISANLAGIPGMSVPGGFTEEGLPVGIQLQANHFMEENLFQMGAWLEREIDLKKVELDL